MKGHAWALSLNYWHFEASKGSKIEILCTFLHTTVSSTSSMFAPCFSSPNSFLNLNHPKLLYVFKLE